jgi:hypothetical protein
MSDRGRVVLIIAVITLLVGGGGFYFVYFYQPAKELKAAQEEIAEWELRYQKARACLLGEKPGSMKTSEALAIRELAPDPWDRGTCTPVISKLSRGMGSETGLQRVEESWVNLDRAAQEAAFAFAKHVSGTTLGDDDALPAALDKLDAARRTLRSAAELAADEQAGTALRPAEIVRLVDGKDPVTDLTIDAFPSAHGLVVFGRTDKRQVQVVLAAGTAPKVARVGPGSIRATPDLSWGATPGMLTLRTKMRANGEVKAGAMDAEGAIAAPQALSLDIPIEQDPGAHGDEELKPGDQVGSGTLAAVAGSLADGALVYGGNETLVIARANANVIKAEPPLKIDIAAAATDIDGRIAVVWSTPDKVHRALLLRSGGQDAFELPASFSGTPCMTADRVWVTAVAPELFAFGGRQPLARYPLASYARLQGCTAEAALVRKGDLPREVAICVDQCRNALIPSGAPESSAVTAVGGKLRAIAAHAGVLGVWSEDKPPVFYALPAPAKPVAAMALTNGKVIDVIARSGKMFVLIRIPAT